MGIRNFYISKPYMLMVFFIKLVIVMLTNELNMKQPVSYPKINFLADVP